LKSPEFQDLFQKMVAHAPQERANIVDIVNHPWLNGDVADKDTIHAHFSKCDEQL